MTDILFLGVLLLVLGLVLFFGGFRGMVNKVDEFNAVALLAMGVICTSTGGLIVGMVVYRWAVHS